MKQGPTSEDDSYKSLESLGRPQQHLRGYFPSMHDLGAASNNLNQYFGLDKSVIKLKDKRLHELLESEYRFYLSLGLSTSPDVNAKHCPRDQLIQALRLKQNQAVNPCIEIFQALAELEPIVKANFDLMQTVFKVPVGSEAFNQRFLAWLDTLPSHLLQLEKYALLIEKYQTIHRDIRDSVASLFKNICHQNEVQIDGCLVGVMQRITRYPLLLRDAMQALEKASKRQSFHLMFEAYPNFCSSFQKSFAEIEQVVAQINARLESQRNEQKPKTLLTSHGKIHFG